MTRIRIWSCIIVAVITLSQPIATWAKVSIPSLTHLALTADVIVVARVERVSANASGDRLAEARVLAVWKGKPGSVVTFRASRSWECDSSDAQEGETVVLFLVKKPLVKKPQFSVFDENKGFSVIDAAVNSSDPIKPSIADKKPRTTVMSIAHWGQGRIPIETEDGKALVFLAGPEDCIEGVTDLAPPELQPQESIGTIEVSELQKRVRKILREKRAPCEF